MRSEAEIRLMMTHVHGLVQKYQAIKEQAVASGDRQAERAAWTKEVSYVSALEALGWTVGDIEASFDQGEAVLVQPHSTDEPIRHAPEKAERKPKPQEPLP